MIFYLGTHRANWLEQTSVPLCVSRRILAKRKTMPRAIGPWMLDSGGFTELALHGEWTIGADEFYDQAEQIVSCIGRCVAIAPQDWMCEPSMLAKTGLTVSEHQVRTLENYLLLRPMLGKRLFPVLQGWDTVDYLRHWDMYVRYGVDLVHEPVVGLGSVCRRGSDKQIAEIVRELQPLNLHGFGVRGSALKLLAPFLSSADSMAWSYQGRRMNRLIGCDHKAKNEANCLRWAMEWREHRMHDLNQLRIEEDLCVV